MGIGVAAGGDTTAESFLHYRCLLLLSHCQIQILLDWIGGTSFKSGCQMRQHFGTETCNNFIQQYWSKTVVHVNEGIMWVRLSELC